jgi:hypothetical protein
MAGSRVVRRYFLAFLAAAALPYLAVHCAQTRLAAGERKPAPDPVNPVSVRALWHDPGDVASLDLAFGSGGRAHAPREGATYSFVKEDLGGSSAKFYVRDDAGVEWLVKVGDEARGETAATRLVWAMGYFTDEDYFVRELHVSGLGKLRRHSKSIHKDGTITNARLKRSLEERKKVANWDWASNPFRGSRELNGLRVMMALLNNWDLKTVNNKVYAAKRDHAKRESDRSAGRDGQEKLGGGHDEANDSDARPDSGLPDAGSVRYVVSDLGASFGRTGAFFSRSKGKWKDFTKDKFISATTPETVDFVMRTKPGKLVRFFKPGYARQRVAMAATVQNIPRTDAKWIGAQLARLRPEQIRAAFAASGFTASEVEGYSAELAKRIAELNAL